ncbi:MAG: CinA family protein [Spirochaetota bacterium]
MGTVWIGWCSRVGATGAKRFQYDGDRAAVRSAAARDALRVVVRAIVSA